MAPPGERYDCHRVRKLALASIACIAVLVSSQGLAKSLLNLQRELFHVAVQETRAGDVETAMQAVSVLEGYPLVPYLELELVKARIFSLTEAEIDTYLSRHEGSIVGNYMKQAWLHRLVRNREWQTFLEYTNGRAPRGMRCEFITALRQTGRAEAADRETGRLWLAGYSLPEKCDSVLANWLARLTPAERDAVHWQRASLALKAGQSGLAGYLLRKIPGTARYQMLLSDPERLFQEGPELAVNEFSRALVLHTLKRLAASDYDSGHRLWQQLKGRFQFTAEQNFELRDSFARQMIADGADGIRDWLNAADPEFEDPYLTEWRVRLALGERDWDAAQRFISALPQAYREEAGWQYWWARTDIERHQRMRSGAEAILRQLSVERGYYSFLSADLLNRDYQLGARRSINAELLERLAQRDDVQRAKELYWHGLVRNANAEWRRAVRDLERDEQVAAAQLALDWGWPHAAIMTAIRAKEWDDLELRFPLAFQDTFTRNAQARNMDLNWVYAIARQESAFAEHARSRRGARGVMQLMPSTARAISSDMGRRYPTLKELYTPSLNIEMGTFYLRQLLEEFDGNHILATAAYNAGPNRIKRTLERQKNVLPADIWIENLPYSETREYIKRVLAFNVVYALKLNDCEQLGVLSGCSNDEGRYTVIRPTVLLASESATGS